MKKTIKRTLTLVLALIMLMCAVPFSVSAEIPIQTTGEQGFVFHDSDEQRDNIYVIKKIDNEIWVVKRVISEGIDIEDFNIDSDLNFTSEKNGGYYGDNYKRKVVITMNEDCYIQSSNLNEVITQKNDPNMYQEGIRSYESLTTYNYNSNNKLTSINDNTYYYNEYGEILENKSEVKIYEYDELNRLTEYKHSYYIDLDNLIYFEKHNYEYNSNGDIVKDIISTLEYERTDIYEYEYDSYGRMTKACYINNSEPVIVYTYEYDNNGRLSKVARSDRYSNGTIAYEYHNNGVLKSKISSDGIITTYDDCGRMLSETRNNYTVTCEWEKLKDVVDTTEPSTAPTTEPTTTPSTDNNTKKPTVGERIRAFFQRIIDWFKNLFKR